MRYLILMAKAKKLTRLSKKVEVVNYALAELVRHKERMRILEFAGQGQVGRRS